MSSSPGTTGAPVLLTSLSRRRASEEAHDQLRTKILSGEIPAGTRLFEVTYARDLGISQSTLREALARLAHEGLVLNVPRRGTYVASLPVDTVHHLYELRERVEPLAMHLAMRARPTSTTSSTSWLGFPLERLPRELMRTWHSTVACTNFLAFRRSRVFGRRWRYSPGSSCQCRVA